MYNTIDGGRAGGVQGTGLHGCFGPGNVNNSANIDPYLLRTTWIAPYVCPSDDTARWGDRAPTNYPSAYVADHNHHSNAASNIVGMLHDKVSRIRDVVDGTSNTLAVGEVYRGVLYLQHGGGQQDRTGRRCGSWVSESDTCECDGTAAPNFGHRSKPRNQNGSMDPMATPDQRTWMDPVNWGNNNVNETRLPLSSAHTGGAQACYGDGSVHFIGENTDLQVLRNSITRAGGEVDVIQF